MIGVVVVDPRCAVMPGAKHAVATIITQQHQRDPDKFVKCYGTCWARDAPYKRDLWLSVCDVVLLALNPINFAKLLVLMKCAPSTVIPQKPRCVYGRSSYIPIRSAQIDMRFFARQSGQLVCAQHLCIHQPYFGAQCAQQRWIYILDNRSP